MAALLFISFIVLLLIGVPVAFAIAAAALLVLLKGDVKLLILVQRMFASTDSFSLIAVPFFIFAGDLLAKGKVSKVLVEFAESLLGMLKGGLSIVSVLAGMFFAAISGSGAATTAAVGATLIPELKKRGYREDSAAALIAAAGTIGVVIPPSVPMVLYAVISEDSVNTLFKNGFVPGILMGVILVAISLYQARKFNYPKGKAFSVGNVLHTFKEAIWGILMPLIILGGIFSGYFTPSEAAAVAVIYAIFVSFFIYRDLDFKGLVEIMKGSAKTSAVIMIIIACSGPFGWVLANYKIPEAIASGVLGISTNKYVIMFLISLIILLAGDLLRDHHSFPGVPAACQGHGHQHRTFWNPLRSWYRHRHDHTAGCHQPVRCFRYHGTSDRADLQICYPVPDRTDHRILHDRICSASDPGTYVIV